MCSYQVDRVDIDIYMSLYIYIYIFIYIYIHSALCARAEKAPTSMRECAGSSEPLLLADAISNNISCTDSSIVGYIVVHS